MERNRAEAEAEVAAAVADFLEAFAPLDAGRLESWMAPEATAFLPFGASRIDGRAAARATFDAVFAELRRQMPGPPYLRLAAQALRIQWSGEVAVVSFELPHDGVVGRRTMIWERRPEGWRVIHVHASEHGSTSGT